MLLEFDLALPYDLIGNTNLVVTSLSNLELLYV